MKRVVAEEDGAAACCRVEFRDPVFEGEFVEGDGANDTAYDPVVWSELGGPFFNPRTDLEVIEG
jgi:hypothetical protein